MESNMLAAQKKREMRQAARAANRLMEVLTGRRERPFGRFEQDLSAMQTTTKKRLEEKK